MRRVSTSDVEDFQDNCRRLILKGVSDYQEINEYYLWGGRLARP